MKILFINVPNGIEQGKKGKPVFTQPPTMLMWLSAILEEKGIDNDILDAYSLGMDCETILQHVRTKKPDMVAIPVFTSAFYDVLHICKKIKEEFPQIHTVAGGYHASVSVDDLIAAEPIDFACVREGDHTLTELIQALETGSPVDQIKGLCHKKDGQVIVNPPRELRNDFDDIPILNYKKIIDNPYQAWWSINPTKNQKFISTVTGKGCPVDCEWCDIAKTEGRLYRTMSPSRVIKELTYLQNELGVTHLTFDDATLTIYKKRLIEICEGMIANNINIKWSCSSTVQCADDEQLLELMQKAGCEVIFYGIEAGNDKVLKKMKKITKDRAMSVVNKTKKAGIEPHCSFILGLPGDTKASMNETIDFAIKLNPATASFSIAVPFKGTAMFDEYSSKGYIKSFDWRRYGNGKAVIEFGDVTIEYLEDLLVKAHQRFYFRPRFILRKAFHIHSFKEFVLNASIAIGMLRNKLLYKN
jgi:anaerobic magnesium-protoporphyrin IX monomethyl ester cyclase